MRIVAEEGDKENDASRRGGGLAASTSYAGHQHAPAAAFAHKSTRFAPRAGGDVKCLVSYTAGAADAAKVAIKGGGSGREANAPAANCASAAAAAAAQAPLDAVDGRRRRHPPAAAETTPAPPPRRVEWEAAEEEQEELETPLTQQQQRQQQQSRERNRSSESASAAAACFFLDLFSWRDPPLSLLVLAAASAALSFALSAGSSPLAAWAAASALPPPLSSLASILPALLAEPLPALLCRLAFFDLGVNSLRGLLSENLRKRGDLSGSVVEAAAASAAAGAVRHLCSLRDAALNPRDPRAALRTALLLAAGSCLVGSGGGGGGGGRGSSVVSIGALKQVSKVAAVSGFYLSFAAGAAWRWWPRKKMPFSSSSSTSSRRPLLLRPEDLSAAASLASRRLSASLSLASRKTGLSAVAELVASFVAPSLGARVALGSLAAAVAWRLSAWSTRGAALLLLLLFARAHVLGEKASREMTRMAMRHPLLASARKGCAALGSAARERVMMRRRRRRAEEEEGEERAPFFEEGEGEEEEEGDGGRGRGAGGASTDLYSSRLQAAANDVDQQQFPHSSRPAAAFHRRGGGAIR